ncbi:hypothetical protein [Streptomyces sp. NPDC048650]|uniref:hypothetical protein n=1 Tax=Streptomyces sp. NPDC048650 TaxID=3365583 RepID=UPI00371FBD1E
MAATKMISGSRASERPTFFTSGGCTDVRMCSQPQVGPRVIAQGCWGDLDVDVDDALQEQDAEAAEYATWCGVRRCGEVDETGPAVCSEGVEDLLVLEGEGCGVVSDDRRFREQGGS